MVTILDNRATRQAPAQATAPAPEGGPTVRPKRIRLEASTFCQLKCPTCETATGELYRTVPAGFLRFEDFKALLDTNPFVEEIELSNFGEIFLNPQLPRIMEYAHEKGVALSASNGANLNTVREETLEALVKYGFRHIRCSIDGASPEIYATYRVKGDFDTVIGNIRRINAYKEAYGSRYPELTWQFVVFGHNEHEIAAARAMAEDLGMNFLPKLNWDDSYSPVRDPVAVAAAMAEGVASRREYKAKYGAHYMEKVCHQLWDEPQINFDGTVFGCCRNNWKPFSGNAFRDGLEAVLNSADMAHARAMLTEGAAPRDDVPCTTCRLYTDMRADGRRLARPD